MLRLQGRIRHYNWGSDSALPAFTNSQPDGKPWAEIWYGAHPKAPSLVSSAAPWIDGDQPIVPEPARFLDDYLGSDTKFPFLAKLLSASRALSLQVHPSLDVARTRFRKQVEAGIPESERLYADAMHKPETLIALVPTKALIGFRNYLEIQVDLRSLGSPVLDLIADQLGPEPESLKRAFERALCLGGAELMSVLDLIGQYELAVQLASDSATEEWAHAGNFGPSVSQLTSTPILLDSLGVASALIKQYPGDPGVVGSIFLNSIQLAPGQALSIGAGVVHSYIFGGGLEVMASSDNVLRAGLTSKKVAISELLGVVDFKSAPPLVDVPTVQTKGSDMSGWSTLNYPAHFTEYSTTCYQIHGNPGPIEVGGPDAGIIVGVGGSVIAESMDSRASLAPGDAVFLHAGETVRLTGERGTVAHIRPRAK